MLFYFTRLAGPLLPLFSVSWLSGPLLWEQKWLLFWYIVYIKAAESYIWPCPCVPQPCSLWGNALQCRVIWSVYDTDMCVNSNVINSWIKPNGLGKRPVYNSFCWFICLYHHQHSFCAAPMVSHYTGAEAEALLIPSLYDMFLHTDLYSCLKAHAFWNLSPSAWCSLLEVMASVGCFRGRTRSLKSHGLIEAFREAESQGCSCAVAIGWHNSELPTYWYFSL